jgi:hypothetical protein
MTHLLIQFGVLAAAAFFGAAVAVVGLVLVYATAEHR